MVFFYRVSEDVRLWIFKLYFVFINLWKKRKIIINKKGGCILNCKVFKIFCIDIIVL